MRRVRRILSALTTVWVCCHAAGLIASPLAVCVDELHQSADTECTCAHGGDHATCPMHHSAPARSSSKSNCSCKSTADPHEAIVVAIVGPIAVVVQRAEFDEPFCVSTLTADSARHLQSAPLAPDGPPPRA